MVLKEVYSQNLKRKFEIEVPASLIDKGFEEAIRSRMQRNIYPGFRKGRVPFDFVAKQEEGLIDSVIVDQVYRHWCDIKDRENLVIFNDQENIAKIETDGYKKEKANVSFTVECELLPDVPEIDFSKMTVKARTFIVSQNDIDLYKERIKDNLVTWDDVDASSAAEDGDRVVLDLNGTVHGKPFKGGQLMDFQCRIGDGKIISSLNDGLIGMKSGEKKVISVAFPEDYHDREVAGKEASFDTTLKSIKRAKKVADPDAALLTQLHCKTQEELDTEIKKIITSECEIKLNEDLRRQIESNLEKYDFLVPDSLVEQQKHYIKMDTPRIADDKLQDEALRRAKLSLIFAQFATKKEISLDKADVARHLMTVSAAAGLDLEYLANIYRNNKDFANSVTLRLMEGKIITALLGTVQRESTESTVEEILAAQKQEIEADKKQEAEA
ncbi:trigger factor [Neorickettsia helminthoeca str. Oregon]|uniref:Trigger factor n=1 Tax=Neorickettsia helminthoeca str. Oregon TaxID=1286528 RepID=X5H4Z8_9RICK|nr:trigger factor [Neorickettsia helminthoeca]AHX11646.1 trigger factor [Neorickettsia helminthoeca str. Oregon]